MSKCELLKELFDRGLVNTRPGAIFETTPPPLGEGFDFRRIQGMLLGLAIGDSLGVTTESINPGKRHARFGEITDYLPNRHAYNQRVGLPSDDTQLAFWTIEQILRDKAINPENVAQRFTKQKIFGIGQTVLDFLRNYKAGVPWYKSGPESAGNGALMRICPVMLPYMLSPSRELWADTVLLTMITHNDSAAIGCNLAFVSMLWELLQCQAPPPGEWYLNHFVRVLSEVEINNNYSPRGGMYTDFRGTLGEYLTRVIPAAYQENLSVIDACNTWYSGAYLLETVPSMLYILMKWGHDPEQAIIRAVNDTRDNDTTASLVGTALGALHGIDALPVRWINNLSGRCGENDVGRVFTLINRAEKQWWKSATKPVTGTINRFEGLYFYLRNSAYSPITANGIIYPTVEHAFQAAKTSDNEIKAQIARMKSPGQARKRGHQLILPPDWDEVKVDIMYDLLKQKFSTYPDLMELLHSTGKIELIAGNSKDETFWGVCNGKGSNELGKLLMRLRERQ